MSDDRFVYRCYPEHPKYSGQYGPRLVFSLEAPDHIEHCGHRMRCEIAPSLSSVNCYPHRQTGRQPRLPSKQDVQNDIRVNENLGHEYFFTR